MALEVVGNRQECQITTRILLVSYEPEDQIKGPEKERYKYNRPRATTWSRISSNGIYWQKQHS
ncbi:hypothetical protein M378DRAFT_163954 [Amanita muscaria Koide BX008]|uniref:Uncharacterized protein n=1 Tax=Amanita muscaria (strain Koide BX008) TaxID=946122 RepID=A0A0C2X3I5_AMAMK|nr:hypothetical protein M378DRAFT_163954 [Amanita muscaria Koide BX008]